MPAAARPDPPMDLSTHVDNLVESVDNCPRVSFAHPPVTPDFQRRLVENLLKTARPRLPPEASFQSIQGVISRDAPYLAPRHAASPPVPHRATYQQPPLITPLGNQTIFWSHVLGVWSADHRVADGGTAGVLETGWGQRLSPRVWRGVRQALFRMSTSRASLAALRR